MKTLVNLIIALFSGFVGAIIVAKPLDSFTRIEPDLLNGIAIFAAIVSFLIAYNILKSRNIIAGTAASVKSLGDDICAKIEANDSDYLSIAEKEVNEGDVDDALWSQALVKAKGVESQRKYQYMKLRSRQLKRV